MKNLSLYVIILAAIGLTSCSGLRIEKRRYSGGFYVEFGNNKHADKPNVAVETEKENVSAVNSFAASETTETIEDKAVVPGSVPNTSIESVKISSSESADNADVSDIEAPSHSINKHVIQQRKSGTETQPAPVADVPLWVYVLLCIFIPPLAVFLKQGITNWFWICLICAILGGWILYTPFLGGFWLAAVIIAFLVVFEVI